MPREIIPDKEERKGPPEVYVSLRDLVGLQHDAHGFSFLPRHAIQSLLSGRHRSRLRGRGLDFDEVRKYVAGDDIRNIDWRVTARVGETHSKVFTEERERPVLLVVDQSSSMFFGSRIYLKSVIAAHAAALAAWRTLEVGDRLGGIVFDDTHLDYVIPKRNRRSVQRILDLVARRNQNLGPEGLEGGENQLLAALSQAMQLISHDYLVVVISDFQNFDDEVMKVLIQISRHNDLIAARVIDPAEEKLPRANLVLGDGTYQSSLEYRKKVRAKFDHAQEKEQDYFISQMSRFGILQLNFNTVEAVSIQLRKALGGTAKKERTDRMIFNLDEMMAGQQLELGVPWALWLLPLPLLLLILPPMRYRAEALFVPFFVKVLAAKGEKASKGVAVSRRNVLQVILMWLVWICLVVALTSPQQVGEPEKQIKTARNMLLNVDLSLSMDSRDWISASGQRTTRWEAVKEVMDEFITKREGDRLGLVLFGTQAYLQAPFTTDLQVIRGLLAESEIGLAGAKTVIGNAIGKAIELFESDSIQERVMILVTDGADSGSELPPLQAARLAALDSITIYTIGIGSVAAGAYELDEPTLTEIAELTGGQYFRASDREDLLGIYELLDDLEPIEFEDEDYIPRRLLFYYPLMAAFGLVVLFHLLAGLLTTVLFLFHRLKPGA